MCRRGGLHWPCVPCSSFVLPQVSEGQTEAHGDVTFLRCAAKRPHRWNIRTRVQSSLIKAPRSQLAAGSGKCWHPSPRRSWFQRDHAVVAGTPAWAFRSTRWCSQASASQLGPQSRRTAFQGSAPMRSCPSWSCKHARLAESVSPGRGPAAACLSSAVITFMVCASFASASLSRRVSSSKRLRLQRRQQCSRIFGNDMSRRQPVTERNPRSVDTGVGQDCFNSAVVSAAESVRAFCD